MKIVLEKKTELGGTDFPKDTVVIVSAARGEALIADGSARAYTKTDAKQAAAAVAAEQKES